MVWSGASNCAATEPRSVGTQVTELRANPLSLSDLQPAASARHETRLQWFRARANTSRPGHPLRAVFGKRLLTNTRRDTRNGKTSFSQPKPGVRSGRFTSITEVSFDPHDFPITEMALEPNTSGTTRSASCGHHHRIMIGSGSPRQVAAESDGGRRS